jgi:hypothetical protein
LFFEEDEMTIPIGMDFDGLFHDLAVLKHRVLRDVFKRTMLEGRERKDFMIAEGIVTEEEYYRLATEICCTERYVPHMVPLPGMVSFFPRIRALSDNHTVRIVTARNALGTVVAQKWVNSLCLGAKVESSNATGTKGPHAKGLHVFVDDDLRHLEEMEGIVPHRFLFSWPYNEMDKHDPSIVRVHSWRELHDHMVALTNAYSKE